jgi:hypothetical protein
MAPPRLLAGLLLALACAPQSADRASLTGPPVNPQQGQTDARTDPASAGGPADARRADGARVADARIDRATPPDRMPPVPDAPPVPEARPPADAAAEAPASQIALLVVGAPGTLSGGDNRLRAAILSKGLTLRIADDNADANVTGVRLVVLSGSCASATLGTKYRDVMVPVVSTEAAVYDSMGMTGAGTGLGSTAGGSLAILMPGHPLAAGLQGTVGVVSTSSNLGWGRPGPGADRVASIPGIADQIAIFGYPKGAMMAAGLAADRRVGFFGTDDAAPNLAAAGVRLLGAAIDWALLP